MNNFNSTLYFICFRLLNPVVSRFDRSRKKELKKKLVHQQFEEVEVRKCYFLFLSEFLFLFLNVCIYLLFNIVS